MTAYWFKPKRYGYGATPVTWQGWLVTLVGPAVFVAAVLFAGRHHELSRPLVWLPLGVLLAAMLTWSIIVTRRHTDGEWRWRWGERVRKE